MKLKGLKLFSFPQPCNFYLLLWVTKPSESSPGVCGLKFLIYRHYRGVATGGPGGPWPPHFIFRANKGPKLSVSNIRDIAFYGCLKFMRTKNFTILLCMLQFLDNLGRFFIISNYIWGIDHSTFDLLKNSDT